MATVPRGKRPRQKTGEVHRFLPSQRAENALRTAVSRVKGVRASRRFSADQIRRAKLKKAHPDAAALIEGYARALIDGDLSKIDPVSVTALAGTEIIRRMAEDEVHSRGVLIEEALLDSRGNAVGIKVKANPAVEALISINEQLGHTAEDLQLSRKSRGEGARDAAVAMALRRDALLRSLDKNRMALPPERPQLPAAIETEVVK
jgi:hypothetical protein